MAVWVLKKPLQHIPMAVNTATSLPVIHPLAIKGGHQRHGGTHCAERGSREGDQLRLLEAE